MGSRKGARQRGARATHKEGREAGGETLLARAYRLHRSGEVQAAQQAYDAFLARFPRHGEALGNYALLLHSQGQVERAVALYQQALVLSPGLVHLHACLGNAFREMGQPAEAISAYKKGLASGHHQSDILLGLGLAHGDAGQFAEAQACFTRILTSNPSDSLAAYHLGLLFFQQEEYAEARACFDTVVRAQPDYVDACFNLALCHKALGQPDVALDYLTQAAALAPDDADILYNIGVLHKDQGNLAAAEASFLQALALEPTMGICLTDLAILYHIDNRLSEAKVMYERALASGYQPDSAHHMLAALAGETTAQAPPQHVRDLFDNYAKGFDDSLVHDLHYSVPAQLAACFQEIQVADVLPAGLDLGCGTGLSGLAFRQRVGQFTGVDLSEKMLARAASKGLYDELHCADLLDFLQTTERRYDLALATDVFVYLGELRPFFQHLAGALNPGGFLLFSVESCEQGYCLRQSGRYAHGPDYLAQLAACFQFHVLCRQSTGIRKERGEWIPGELYIMQRP